MSYCINPSCPSPNDPANAKSGICRNCGSELLLQGRYQVMRLLSDNSGFGNIYEAYEGATPKILKILKENYNKNPKVVELFQQEAVVLSCLKHPGIPKVEADGYFQFLPKHGKNSVHCIIMEKIDGLNLKQWMNQQGDRPISQTQALNWLKQLAEILHIVHKKNYFHRDIKPQNIMLRASGQLVLIDFGTAREMTYTYLAEVGKAGKLTRISSAGYTPPEQEKGHAVPQSDFYALGRTFVYLLTSKQATDKDIYHPLTDKCDWRNYAPDISPKVADFIDKLMAPTAGERPKNTQEILDELDNISLHLSQPQTSTKIKANTVTQPPLNIALPPTKVEKAKNQGLILGAIVLVGLLGGYGGLQLYNRYAPQFITSENLTLVNTLVGHSSFVNYLVISPDGQKLVSASADKTIKIWNLATAKEIRTLRGHLSYVNYLVLSPDGEIIASASADKTIKIWNLQTGKEIRTLKGHSSFVNSLAISPDGETIASGSADNTIKIWNLYSGKEIRTLRGHSSPINCLAISSDGKTLASASADKIIKLWNLYTGKEIGTLKGHSNYVNALAISPDGQTLASGSADKTIKIWNLYTRQEIRTLKGHANYVNYLAISPDGQRLVSGSADKTIKIWNMSNGQEIRTLEGHYNWVNYLAISPDGQTIATGSGDKTIKIWRVSK